MPSVLYSHPDQELKNHLSGVYNLSMRLLGGRGISAWEQQILENLLSIVTLCHDFGKATRYFQRYITSQGLGKKRGGPLERHALLSAVVGYYIAKYCFNGHPEVDKLCLFVYMAIKRHHGNLHDLDDELSVFGERDKELLLKQIKAIDFSSLQETWHLMFSLLPQPVRHVRVITEDLLEDWVHNMDKELRRIRRAWEKETARISFPFSRGTFLRGTKNEESKELLEYFRFNYMYSLLLDADKYQAGLKEYHIKTVDLPPDLVDTFKQKQIWGTSPINRLREEAYQEIASGLSVAEQNCIFRVTLPTGLGKTLATYNFAFKLREKRMQQRGIAPTIIYALPFLTVIDQNYQSLIEVFHKQEIPFDQNTVIKHHHLTDPVYTARSDDDENIYSPNAAKLLIEGWSSDIVVTTFVQLFETLIGWRNSSLRRFHRLAHSIIILDEIQALPVPYWPLAEQMLSFLTKYMFTDIILVTATQPRIFTGSTSTMELVDPHKYFDQMDRVKMEVDLLPKTVREFVEGEVKEKLAKNPGKSFLFILNTISSAKELYRCLKEITDEPVAFLSTGVVMYQRKKRIKEVVEKKYRLVVSTQLVEAGVDIDFDIVYRDFAPMDAINQAAGRCNRHAERSGLVQVIALVCVERRRPYANKIYNDVALDITAQILKDKKVIRESEFLGLIDIYFTHAKSKNLAELSIQLLEAIGQMRFSTDDDTKTSVSSFRLIKEKGLRANVFIEVNKEAEEAWLQYENIIKLEDFYKRQDKFAEIKKTFYDYVISIPIGKSAELPPEVNHFLYVNRLHLNDYYDINLGYDSKGIDVVF